MAKHQNKPTPPTPTPNSGPKQNRVTAVVGFGASAGGLQAFEEVLRQLPEQTGMAFIFVQHLDPRHESLLTDLLGRATPMKVLEAQDGAPIEPDHVYVIRPNTILTVSDHRLSVKSRGETMLQMPVDLFFRSLAVEY